MKFFGNGIVWDNKSNSKLCTFMDGIFETEDKKIIQKLKTLGYKIDVPEETDNELIIDNNNATTTIDYESMSFGDLKSLASQLGINTYKMNKQNIIDSILHNKG